MLTYKCVGSEKLTEIICIGDYSAANSLKRTKFRRENATEYTAHCTPDSMAPLNHLCHFHHAMTLVPPIPTLYHVL